MKMWRKIALIFAIFNFKTVELGNLTANYDYDEEYGEIIHVTAIFRHGDRSPTHTYPSDPNRNYSWPDGLGQLLKTGKQRLYNLGKWYRQRYSKLVRKITSHVNIRMKSSDTDRTIMSAQCFLAGFYPPSDEKQYLDEYLRWQPVPIHVIPLHSDNIIQVVLDECPAKIYYVKKLYNSEKYKKLYDKHKRTFDYLGHHTGFNFSRDNVLYSIIKTVIICDAARVATENNLPLPPWIKIIYPRPMLTVIEDFLQRFSTFTLRMKRLLAGPLLGSVISNMAERTGKNSPTIFNFYSGHDLTIAYLLTSLGFPLHSIPPYGSSFMFELRSKDGQHFVTIFYANSTTETPRMFKPIPKCGWPCTLENFERATRHLIPSDYNAECRMN